MKFKTKAFRRLEKLTHRIEKQDKEIGKLTSIIYNISNNSKPPKYKYKIGDDMVVSYTLMFGSVKIVHRRFDTKTYQNMYTLGFTNEVKEFAESDIYIVNNN